MFAVRTLRTHPKKFLAASFLALYGSNYLINLYREDVDRRRLCNLIKPFGQETVGATQQLRRVTVFLNPFARRGKLLKEFEKNVAPILQLSGLDVQMVYTDNDAEIKDFVSVLDPVSTDGILIASDDHGLQKAITALMQRVDFKASNLFNLPVGIVPVGIWNSFADSLVLRKTAVQWCYDLLYPLLNGSSKRHSVLEISSVDLHSNESCAENGVVSAPPSPAEEPNLCAVTTQPSLTLPSTVHETRKTYSLIGLEWSVWRDVENGGGFGAPKRKTKPTDINEHRGTLAPLSLLSPQSWMRQLGLVRRHAWFWLTSATSVPDEHSGEEATVLGLHRRLRSKNATLIYTPACDGCSNCWESRRQEALEALNGGFRKPAAPSSTFSRLFGLSRVVQPSHQTPNLPILEDCSSVINAECGQTRTVELRNMAGVTLTLKDNRVQVRVDSTSRGFLNHIRRSLHRLKSIAYSSADSSPDDLSHTFDCAYAKLIPTVIKNEYFWIDNDHFEACPVEVSVRPYAFNMYQ